MNEIKDSRNVTAMYAVGFIFGLIGILVSFIPCIGSLAFYIGIPATIVSGIVLIAACLQNRKRSYAIVAVSICLVVVLISSWQYVNIISVSNKAKQAIEELVCH